MLLSDILYKVALKSVSGVTDIEINNIQFDSRQVNQESLLWPYPEPKSMDMNI